MAQLQSLLQNGVHRAREFRFSSARHQEHLPTAPQQVRQAGLVQSVDKLTIDAPAIAYQKTLEVCSQHQSGLFESPPWLNAIDGDLRRAESPHPPQLPIHSPARFIRSYTRTPTNLFYQRVIRWFCFTRYPRHRLA